MGRVLKGALGAVALSVCALTYLLMTGERSLALTDRTARTLEVSRLNAEDTKGLGWNPERLDAVFDYAATLSADSLMIVTRDRIVASFGDLARPYRVHSIRKALLSQHIGPGPRQIRLDATLAELNMDDAPGPLTALQRQATVEHLLKSVSGINHPAAAEAGLTADKDRRLGHGENTPGTVWAYNNWDYNVLTSIFEKRTGLTIGDAFLDGIARPAGMRDFTVNAVSYIEAPGRSRHRAAAFTMSARDLARFGQLYLDGGEVGETSVIPAAWVGRITDDFTRTGRNDLRSGHGYLWWIPGPDTGLPEGSYWAWGLGNQALVIIPAWRTVVVHQSDTTEFLKRFIPLIDDDEASEEALERLILECTGRNRSKEYCVEHRFTTRREFEKLIFLIAAARIP